VLVGVHSVIGEESPEDVRLTREMQVESSAVDRGRVGDEADRGAAVSLALEHRAGRVDNPRAGQRLLRLAQRGNSGAHWPMIRVSAIRGRERAGSLFTSN
jgi:hypothetical protein